MVMDISTSLLLLLLLVIPYNKKHLEVTAVIWCHWTELRDDEINRKIKRFTNYNTSF